MSTVEQRYWKQDSLQEQPVSPDVMHIPSEDEDVSDGEDDSVDDEEEQ